MTVRAWAKDEGERFSSGIELCSDSIVVVFFPCRSIAKNIPPLGKAAWQTEGKQTPSLDNSLLPDL